ncbi:hypothetical protein EHP00_570 [Ecytonucleospora hepatopenaei]|uniref:Protein kinase domain-containing protein n=1 Tax=Ecytonucleospora hepatopenaei TaxID=646526 RepID=A0A1W0E8H9_9MICR|nr:hypothetical protein EHP00_570 [Ecytonucleospora hepatopenaei]
MKLNFLKGNDTLEGTFPNYKCYKSDFNGKECTKINHNQNINRGDMLLILQKLKTISKSFLPPIYRITAHSFFTKRLFFYKNTNNLTKQYRKYVFYVFKKAIDFLHENGIEHSNITMDSFFIDEYGNPCLCDVINFRLSPSIQNEEFLILDGLCKKETGQSLEYLEGYEFFVALEEFFSDFKTLSFEEKTNCMVDMVNHRKEIPQIIKENIYRTFISYLDVEGDKAKKESVLDFLRNFDGDLFKKNQVALFRVIDYNVRLYMLTAIESIENIDECADEIALGIRVKEKPLRHETLSFVFKYDKKFTKRSFALFLYTMADCSLDAESIEFVCKKLLATDIFYLTTTPLINKTASTEFLKKNKRENREFAKILYKTLMVFLKSKKCRKEVYACFLKYFEAFDKTKVASELLPLLCSKLSEKECQEECFLLVERIVQFLKENRKDLEQSEWSLSKAKDVFMSKQDKREAAFKTKIDEIKTKEGFNEEWDDQDVN